MIVFWIIFNGKKALENNETLQTNTNYLLLSWDYIIKYKDQWPLNSLASLRAKQFPTEVSGLLYFLNVLQLGQHPSCQYPRIFYRRPCKFPQGLGHTGRPVTQQQCWTLKAPLGQLCVSLSVYRKLWLFKNTANHSPMESEPSHLGSKHPVPIQMEQSRALDALTRGLISSCHPAFTRYLGLSWEVSFPRLLLIGCYSCWSFYATALQKTFTSF